MVNVRRVAYTGIMVALVTAATSLKLPMPIVSGGYVHLGDCMVFLSAILLGWKYGAAAAGLGSMLADIMGGYMQWAPFTLIIKVLMAVLVGIAFSLKKKKSKIYFSSSVIAIWTVFVITAKSLLNKAVDTISPQLVDEIETVNSVPELISLNNYVQTVLLVSTLLVVVIAAGLGAYMYRKGHNINLTFIMGIIAAGLWMAIGYYIAEYVIYGSYVVPVVNIPFNILQFTTGMIIALLVYAPLKKIIILK